MKKVILSILVLLLFVLTGCEDSSIEQVKTGTLYFDQTAKVGNVLDNYPYFKSKEWTEFEDQSKRKIVQFEGVYDLSKHAPEQPKEWSGGEIKANAALALCKREKDSILYSNDMKLVIQFRIIDNKNFEVGYIGKKFSGKDFPLSLVNLENIYRNQPPDHFHAFIICLDWAESSKKYVYDRTEKKYVTADEIRNEAESILKQLEDDVERLEKLVELEYIPETEYDDIMSYSLPETKLAKITLPSDQEERFLSLGPRIKHVKNTLRIRNIEGIISWLEDSASELETMLTSGVAVGELKDRAAELREFNYEQNMRFESENLSNRYYAAVVRFKAALNKISDPKNDAKLDELEREIVKYEQWVKVNGKNNIDYFELVNEQNRLYRMKLDTENFSDTQLKRYNKLRARVPRSS